MFIHVLYLREVYYNVGPKKIAKLFYNSNFTMGSGADHESEFLVLKKKHTFTSRVFPSLTFGRFPLINIHKRNYG